MGGHAVSFMRRDTFGFRRGAAGSIVAAQPSVREIAREVLGAELERRRQRPPQESVAGLSPEAWTLIRVLRALEGAALVDDARAGFAALSTSAEKFDRALAELAGAGLLEVGPAMGSDGQPASRGLLALRYDVHLPEDP